MNDSYPKPAWHDAHAVHATTASNTAFYDIFISDNGQWRNVDGDFFTASELLNATPLIPAEVTDEMVDRVNDMLRAHYGTGGDGTAYAVICATLGLETDD